EGRLPLFHLLWLVRTLSPTLLVLLGVAVVVAVVVRQLLDVGAIRQLIPTTDGDPKSLWTRLREVMRDGLPYSGFLARVVGMELCLLVLGSAGLGWAFRAWTMHGHQVGWTAWTTWVVGPGAQAIGMAIWVALVGALGHWCRVVAVVDEQLHLRHAVERVWGVWRRHPIQGPVLFVAATLAVQLGMGTVLVLWRQWPPAVEWQVAVMALVWCIAVWLHAAVWLSLMWTATRLYTQVSRRAAVEQL
ncbi:MAG: hypothetical protein AAFS10_27120, partial [Myxococcota bacterium]